MANSAFQQLANPVSTAKSFLVGWRFPTNPWQFNLRDGSWITMSGTGEYGPDQTVIQAEESAQVRYQRDITLFNAFRTGTIPAGTPGRIALVQYIDGATAAGMVGISEFSVRVAAITSAGTMDLKCSLLYAASDAVPLEPIVTWGTNPVFDAAWTELKPVNDPIRTISTPDIVPAEYNRFNLDGVPTGSTLAIVVYTTTDLPAGESIAWGDISLARGPIGLPSNPESADDVLRSCEFYYQKSYALGVLPGTATDEGALFRPGAITLETAGGDTWAFMLGSQALQYVTTLRKTPTHTFYSPNTGTADLIDWEWFEYAAGGARTTINSGSQNVSAWELGSATEHGISYLSAADGAVGFGAFDTSTTTGETKSGYTKFHFTADARIGI